MKKTIKTENPVAWKYTHRIISFLKASELLWPFAMRFVFL